MRISNRVFWAAVVLIGCCIVSRSIEARQSAMFIQTKDLKGTLSANELDVHKINVVNSEGHVAFSVYLDGKTAVMEFGDGLGGTSPIYVNIAKNFSPNIQMLGPDDNSMTLNVGPSGPSIFLDDSVKKNRAGKFVDDSVHMQAGPGASTYLELENSDGKRRNIMAGK